jgi:hypothetical protein
MPQNELRELVKASNPVPNPAVLLREESDLRTLFQEVLHRADDPQTSMYLLDDNVNWRSNMETKHEVLDLELSPEQNERRWWPAATLAAVALAAIALLVFALQPDDSPGEPVATDGVATPTTVPVFTSQDALSVADAYFAANSAGDFDALRALFVADPEFTGQFGIAAGEQLFAWNVAQGTTLSPQTCTVPVSSADSAIVNCTFFNHDAKVQAVDGAPVPIQLYLTITPEGISEESAAFGQPDFNKVGIPFVRWMDENHPEAVDSIRFENWTTIEEAQENGRLTAQYTAEWATFLEANGCAYNDGC